MTTTSTQQQQQQQQQQQANIGATQYQQAANLWNLNNLFHPPNSNTTRVPMGDSLRGSAEKRAVSASNMAFPHTKLSMHENSRLSSKTDGRVSSAAGVGLVAPIGLQQQQRGQENLQQARNPFLPQQQKNVRAGGRQRDHQTGGAKSSNTSSSASLPQAKTLSSGGSSSGTPPVADPLSTSYSGAGGPRGGRPNTTSTRFNPFKPLSVVGVGGGAPSVSLSSSSRDTPTKNVSGFLGGGTPIGTPVSVASFTGSNASGLRNTTGGIMLNNKPPIVGTPVGLKGHNSLPDAFQIGGGLGPGANRFSNNIFATTGPGGPGAPGRIITPSTPSPADAIVVTHDPQRTVYSTDSTCEGRCPG